MPSFVAFLLSPVLMSIGGIRRVLQLTTSVLENLERMIQSPDRDRQIHELKTRIDHLELLIESQQSSVHTE